MYTPEIDAYLIENYESTRGKVLAEKLNLTEVYIRQRAKQLGLKKNREFVSINDAPKSKYVAEKNGASTIYKFN